MRKSIAIFLFPALLLALPGLSASAQIIQESHFCQTNYQDNQYTGHQTIRIQREKPSDTMKHVYFEKSFSFYDFLIYRKGSNELIGDRVHLPIPPFKAFAEWVKACRKSVLQQCNEREYEIQKESHEKDPRWILETYELGENHPEFYKVWSKFIVTNALEGETILVQNSGYNGLYALTEDVPLHHTVLISNQNHVNHVYIKTMLWGFLQVLDGEKSYSPRLDIKFTKGGEATQGSRLTQPCEK